MKQLFLAFASLILFGSELSAQQNSTQQTLTLEECISMALKKSLALQEADLNIQNAEISNSIAKGNRYPDLRGFGGLNNYGLSSSVLLYGGRRISNAIEQSDIDYNVAVEQRRQSEADIALQVSTAYLNTLFAIENINVAEKQLAQTEEQLDFISKLVKAGARPENDKLDIQAQISTNEANIIQAENNKAISLLQLKQLIRLAPEDELSIIAPSDIDLSTDPELVNFIEVYEMTLRSQPAVKAALLQEESAAYNIKIAKADKLPTLSAGGNFSTAYSNRGFRLGDPTIEDFNTTAIVNGTQLDIILQQEVPSRRDASFGEQLQDNLGFGIGLNLSVPIYNRGLTNHNIQRAELGLKSSELATARLKENIQIVVQQALADARAAKKSLAASSNIVEARKAAMENAIKKFEAGSLNTFDLTNIQTQYDNASINFLIDKYNYLFAVKVLEFYMGKPFKL